MLAALHFIMIQNMRILTSVVSRRLNRTLKPSEPPLMLTNRLLFPFPFVLLKRRSGFVPNMPSEYEDFDISPA